MSDQQGVLRRQLSFYALFGGKNVVEIHSFLKKHMIDVNACTVDVVQGVRTSPMAYAMIYFDPAVMSCLFNDFGANPDALCYQGNFGSSYLLEYAINSTGSVEKATEAVCFLLDHGASPFVILGSREHSYEVRAPDAMMLVKIAKERCYTAWATHWVLSQDPVWRDMADQIARCIMATPVREFLEDEPKDIKKRRV